MKILKIEFQNINSLKGRHEIDFAKAPFTVSSLFAITGPTGSGKSSILDVISLALFNVVPRLGKISKSDIINKGALLTRNQKEAFARVTYRTNSGIYASEWSISTNRNNNLRDYDMYLYDMATEKPLDCKKSEVPSKNEELIGLNYNQFIKAVLLAQGDFAQFLKAKKDERGELLEKITGTGIYRQVGIKAFQKFKTVNAEIEDRQREINVLQKDLLEEEALTELITYLDQKTSACEPLEKELQLLDTHLQLKKNLKELSCRIEEKEILNRKATEALEIFNNRNLEKIRRHEQVQVFADELRQWQILDKTCNELQEELKLQAKKGEENEQDIKTCLEKITNFLQTQPKTEEIEDCLNEFLRTVRNLQQRRKDKLEKYDHLKGQFNIELREVPFELNGDLKRDELELQELKSAGERKLQELKNRLKEIDLEDPEAAKNRLRQTIQLGRKAQQQDLAMANLAEALQSAKQEEQKLIPELKELPKQIKISASEAAVMRERLEKLQLQQQNQLLTARLEDLRHNLKEGNPCPLCGSKDHPYSSHLPPKNDKIQEELVATQKKLEELERQTSALNASYGHYKNRKAELQEEILTKSKNMESQKGHFEKEFSALNPSGENWEEFCNNRERKLHFLENFEQEKRKHRAINAGIPIIAQLKEVLAEGKKVKNELDSLYTGKDIDTDCLELQKKWTGLQHQKQSLIRLATDLDNKLKGKRAELQTSESSLKPKVSAIDCEEINEALKRLLPEGDYIELRKEREKLATQKGQIEASLKTLKEQLEHLKINDVEETEEEILLKIQEVKAQLTGFKDECEELRRKQRNHNERREKIGEIEKSLKDAKKSIRRWELLNHLIGDATGKKFNDFAQDLSLSQLLILANRRLKDLSDRYSIDKPTGEEDDSLVAIDEHMGGQRRSVKTLSGGETFLLSLSMALGLSDMASKNVEINSLFIDEGFGTLDPETLDQTLDTLEKLQAESSKTIGVISHVDSLKERIATQIKLTRNGQGYSSLEITG